jgi:hypothetical protein
MILKELVDNELEKYNENINNVKWIGTNEFHDFYITLDNFKELCKSHISFVLIFPIGFRLVFDDFSLFIYEKNLKYHFRYEKNQTEIVRPKDKMEMTQYIALSAYVGEQEKDNPKNGLWVLSCKII